MKRLFLACVFALGCAGEELDGEWAEVERGDLVVGVEVSGTLESIDSVDLKPPSIPRTWRYKIAFMAPEGKDVKKGDPVLGFDTAELQRELMRKQNEAESAGKELERQQAITAMTVEARTLALAEAKGALRKARLKANTPEDLSKAVELAKFKLDLELAEAQVAHLETKATDSAKKERAELAVLRDRRDRANARTAELQANIGKMRIGAPRAGTVIYRSNWRGEKPKVGDDAYRDRKILEIAGVGGLRGAGVVDEVDLARIEAKQPVRLRLDAQPEVEYLAEIEDIGDSIVRKSADNPVKVAKVKLKLEKANAEVMRPGMRYRGVIEVGRRSDVILVPASAIFVTADGPVVYVEGESGPRRSVIEIGSRNDEQVEVVNGLAVGERVSLSNLGGRP